MNYPVMERPIETGRPPAVIGYPEAGGFGAGTHAGNARPADMISRLLEPSGLNASAMSASSSPMSWLFPGLGGMMGLGMGGIITQLIAMLQQFLTGSAGGGSPYGDNEQYFQNATGASVGDPHLSFNGRSWDNMGSQPDLLHSDSFDGGYQISTQTTPPAANGVTYNDSATIATNYGDTRVSLDKAGNATIEQNGASYPLQRGASVDLGNGEFVQYTNDGTLDVTCDNGNGGAIATTLRANGTGVDVTASANNVDLGGTLATGAPPSPPTLIPLGEQRPQPHPPLF